VQWPFGTADANIDKGSRASLEHVGEVLRPHYESSIPIDVRPTMAECDFSRSCIIGYGFSPSRRGPEQHTLRSCWPTVRSPGSRTKSLRTCQGLRPRRITQAARSIATEHVVFCKLNSIDIRNDVIFRGSMAGLCAPLSTLRRGPRGQLRMTRGRCGLLLLHRGGRSPPTLCRSPGALSK
jgi:hypothetical protein